MGRKIEGVNINQEMCEELEEKLKLITTEKEEADLCTEYYNKIFIKAN